MQLHILVGIPHNSFSKNPGPRTNSHPRDVAGGAARATSREARRTQAPPAIPELLQQLGELHRKHEEVQAVMRQQTYVLRQLLEQGGGRREESAATANAPTRDATEVAEEPPREQAAAAATKTKRLYERPCHTTRSRGAVTRPSGREQHWARAHQHRGSLEKRRDCVLTAMEHPAIRAKAYIWMVSQHEMNCVCVFT